MTTRVLIVDDSATMRGVIAAVLRRDPDIEVVGSAGDPLEAREAIKRLNPDVVTLDVEMPNMNGIEFLERIMRLRPTPVIMISTLTQAGADTTIEALALGAVDCVGKPGPGVTANEAFAGLADKVKAAARSRLRPLGDAPRAAAASAGGVFRPNGNNAGGVEALLQVISGFPANCPPTLITQHMPATFTKSFAKRLDNASAAHVTEAEDGDLLEHGRVFLAPGGARHLTVHRTGNQLRCRLVEGEPVNGHSPSVDVLFESVVKAVGGKAAGAILTGMGRDGAKGLLAMRQAGARTLGQDEASCVVYGMPRAAFEIGAVERQYPITRIGAHLLGACAVSAEG
ncbi:MAG TPA: chemotaxis response regulator protein-glutamate methylesterase [Caulobacter sp.]|nr:chemotaxis response regulator protein-glutamate methylesterase [Caulobacter sp.]